MRELRAGIAQLRPAVLDAEGTVDRVVAAIERAAKDGVTLLAFPETFVPVYPLWCDAGAFGQWEHDPAKTAHAALIDASMEVPSPLLDRVVRAAGDHRCSVVLGLNERVGRTLYNAFVVVDREGRLVQHRRKLVPTHGERLVWKPGDAHDLVATDIGGAKVGGLICWEHWMPLPRQVLHDAGEEIHVALWPTLREMYMIASRHYAFEGRCFVLAAGMILGPDDLPESAAIAGDMATTDGLLLDGGSAIIGPDGSLLAGPVHGVEALVTADLDPALLDREALALDVSGHYARADLFRLDVDQRRPRTRPSDG
ncbi:MAG: nitrilase [Planctomycetes bacterium]|nr:nitrilase [Planctomycetota bacterium]